MDHQQGVKEEKRRGTASFSQKEAAGGAKNVSGFTKKMTSVVVERVGPRISLQPPAVVLRAKSRLRRRFQGSMAKKVLRRRKLRRLWMTVRLRP